jgi:DNA-binding response OmpR family regulator/EAL domain-containing protein (putative c-di-GMP-specific phosphodiesterase class I)
MTASQHDPVHPKTVLFVSDDTDLGARLAPALSACGIDLATLGSVDELAARLERFDTRTDGQRSVVLVDTAKLQDPADLGALAATVRARVGSAIAIGCLAPAADVRFRLAALRAQVADCLDADREPLELAARLCTWLNTPGREQPRVLVVDDQPVAALFATRILEHAGMRTETVGDPLAVLDALERFQPHLVLMDLHMPGASGIELTGIIRGQERFADLPVVFLSGELSPSLQLDALRVGGDDFLAKPASPQRLVSAVRGRLERSRRVAHRSPGAEAPDPATGLAAREGLLKALDRQIRPGDCAGWGLIYLEHPAGGAELARLASALLPRLAPGDLAARAGEHGIAVLARRSGLEDLAAFAQALGRAVSGASAPTDEGPAQPPDRGIDLGIGWCPLSASGGEAVTLVSRARKAARASLREGQTRAVGFARPGPRLAAAERNPILAAILADRLQVLYQPMVALRGDPAERYEATPRLHTPDGELLPPGLFGPLALRAGLAERVDRWMLDAGLDALGDCRAAGRPVELFIHRTLANAADDGWIARLRNGIAERDLIRLRPVIQIQIGDADRRLELAVRRAGELARLGLRLCLNGLAEGERGARVLERLPAAYVRLAADAVLTLPADRLRSLAALAQAGGALVIATGVDGPKTIERLYLAGVDLIQGPYVQPPAEAMDFDFRGSEISA